MSRGIAAGLAANQMKNLMLDFGSGMADLDIHQEAIELCLGQAVGALLLDGVLGRHDEEELR